MVNPLAIKSIAKQKPRETLISFRRQQEPDHHNWLLLQILIFAQIEFLHHQIENKVYFQKQFVSKSLSQFTDFL